ncbi:uncharacterized protein LOC126894434 isoform X2 [Daktulosphaira vitifoliae]|uniref:uncharacterized protein LOC126894434 isoform X2 n=1 Tax=Daktulosphaira vitifoliae TaxID=58002 RepID=UPI0021A9A917|nr:uncharacterized protein LOC126894434 isoform X2 [Daktulosphaira vitifoliae]
MHYKMSKVFIILCGIYSSIALPSCLRINKENEELKSVCFELRKVMNKELFSKHKLNEPHELILKSIMDNTIIRAMIQNKKLLVEEILSEWLLKICEITDVIKYIELFQEKFRKEHYELNSVGYNKSVDDILKIIFIYYSDDSEFISTNVFFNLLKSFIFDLNDEQIMNSIQQVKNKWNKSKDNTNVNDDQINFKSFSTLMTFYLDDYLKNTLHLTNNSK